jgi:hypothetical protein
MGATTELAKVKASTAAEVCARFNLKKEARQLLRDGMRPGEFVHALLQNKQYIASIDFLAYALPPREAIWWGCLCLQHASGGNFSPEDRVACKAAVQWIMHPTEENRAATEAPAQAAGLASQAGQLAMAANQTGGTMAAPNAPAKAVATAVKMASTNADPIKIGETQRSFVELGIGVAEGRFR